MPPKSKAQARFLGAVAAGKVRGVKMSKTQAREALRGTKQKNLPERKGKKK